MDLEQKVIHDAIENQGFPVDFASPIAKRLNAQLLSITPEKTEISCAFDAHESDLHGSDIVQGGVICTMLDFTMAMLCLANLAPGKSIGTTNLNTQFLRPALPDRYVCEAAFTRAGKKVLYTSATLLDTDHRKIAFATATNLII
jgi:uncharacterized protein (TIGR00369 family)